MAGEYNLQLDPKFKKMAFDLKEPELSYYSKTDLPSIQSSSRKSDIPDSSPTAKSTGIGTPEMMAASMAIQLVDEAMAAPYKQMAAKQAGEENRRARQENALVNLQNISKMYGNL